MSSQELKVQKLNALIKGIQSITPLFDEKEELGVAQITRFEYIDANNPMYNLRAVRNGGYMMRMYDGHYTRLVVDGVMMMSDTAMERWSNLDFVQRANGRVFIAGLGLGLIIQPLLNNDNVTEIVVVEKYQDVIDLVEPKFKHPKLKVICADIFDFKFPKGELFDTIYFDIWPSIGTENLKEMTILSNRFKNNLNRSNPKAYMDAWLKDYLKRMRRRETSYSW